MPSFKFGELLRIGAFNTETGSICPCEVCQVNFVMSPDRMYAVPQEDK